MSRSRKKEHIKIQAKKKSKGKSGSNKPKRLAIFDGDYIVFAAACVAENQYIEVECASEGIKRRFKGVTEWRGRKGSKLGGWLLETNIERSRIGKAALSPDDFVVTKKQEKTEELAVVLHTAKMMIKGAMYDTGATHCVCYLDGKEELDRHKHAVLKEYKGNRKDHLSPLYKQDVRKYLLKYHNGIIARDGWEADDEVVARYVTEKKKGNDAVVLAIDKDVKGCPVKWYNPNKSKKIVDSDCFGKLWIKGGKQKKVEGYGRKWLYFQVCSGDTSDNYSASCHSDEKWGAISAYEALKDCKTDIQCWKKMKEIFQYLYPSPKTITSWSGKKIKIDWLFVLQELFSLARMKRWEGDVVDVRNILKKYKIDIEEKNNATKKG